MTETGINTLSVAEEYMEAWRDKNPKQMEKLLHPQVHLKSPVTEMSGRESFLGMVEKILPQIKGVKVRAQFATDTQAVMIYDLVFEPPAGEVRTANFMTFEDSLIRSVELFFDPRPFVSSNATQQTLNR